MKIFRNKNKKIIKAIEVLNKTVENEMDSSAFSGDSFESLSIARNKINELIKKLDY